MSTSKQNSIKQLRLREDQAEWIDRLVARSGLSESDVIRMALRAGLPLLEDGTVNVFSEKPAAYKKSSAGKKQGG